MKALEPKIYSRPREFWSEIAPHLQEEEAKNSLCLGLSYHFLQDPTDCVHQSALFQEGKFVGALVVSRYLNQQNLLCTPVQEIEHAESLLKAYRRTRKTAHNLIGELKTANLYRDLLLKSGKRLRLIMSQGIYRCDKVIVPDNPERLLFRLAESRDIETLSRWIEDFRVEALPHDPPVNSRELAAKKIKAKAIYVVEKKGQLVSMAGWGRDIETSCSINLVYTPGLWRKRGFASVVTSKITQLFLERGKKETNLYTDMKNPTSNKIYQDIGYKFVCDSVHFSIKSRPT